MQKSFDSAQSLARFTTSGPVIDETIVFGGNYGVDLKKDGLVKGSYFIFNSTGFFDTVAIQVKTLQPEISNNSIRFPYLTQATEMTGISNDSFDWKGGVIQNNHINFATLNYGTAAGIELQNSQGTLLIGNDIAFESSSVNPIEISRSEYGIIVKEGSYTLKNNRVTFYGLDSYLDMYPIGIQVIASSGNVLNNQTRMHIESGDGYNNFDAISISSAKNLTVTDNVAYFSGKASTDAVAYGVVATSIEDTIVSGNITNFEKDSFFGSARGVDLQGQTFNIRGNTLNLNGLSDGAYGVRSASLSDATVVSNNTTILFSSGEVTGFLYGVWASNHGKIENNSTIVNGKVGSVVGASGGQLSSNNFLSLYGEANYAYAASGNSEAHENQLVIGGSAVLQKDGFGAQVSGQAIGNEVRVENGARIGGSLYGANSQRSSAVGNMVNVFSASVGGDIYGAMAFTSAGSEKVGNFVYVENANVDAVYGGEAVTGPALHNQVLINGSHVAGTIQAGIVRSDSDLKDNLVQINGQAVVNGNVYGAYSPVSNYTTDKAQNNSVSLNGDVTVKGVVYGAAYGSGIGINEGGNTLVFGGHVAASGIDGFSEMHLLVADQNRIIGEPDQSPDSYILTFTSPNDVNLENKKIDIYQYAVANIALPEKYGLMRHASDNGLIHLEGARITRHGAFVDTNWNVENLNGKEVYLSGEDLVIVPPSEDKPITPPSPDTKPGENPSPMPPADIVIGGTQSANENSLSLSDNRLSTIALTHQNADFAAEAVLGTMQEKLKGKHLFAVSSGGHNRYGRSGRRFDLNGAEFVTGIINSVGDTDVGAFFEASWGHAAGNRTGYSGKSNLASYGIGVLANHKLSEYFSVDSSVRIGWVRNEFKGRFFDVEGKADFTTHSFYTTAHLGGAFNYPLSSNVELSLYGRYILSVLGADKVETGGTESAAYKAKTTVSHSIKAGVKTNFVMDDKFTASAGLAVTETMDARARGTIAGYGLKELSINGTTGSGELVLKAKPSASSPWQADIGVKGYVGARKGATGSLRVSYTF